MSNLQTDIPVAVRDEEQIELGKLNDYLRKHTQDIGEVLTVEQFPGGFSNLTYCIKTADKEYVLRRPPFGANIKSAHDMGREFRVLSLLKPSYPLVPQPIVYCETEEVIGAPFYMMERINGVILRAATAPKLKLSADWYRILSEALVDNLVLLHALDIEATGLIQLGKPTGYVHRQVDGWSKRYFDAETDSIEDMNAVAGWLAANIPSEQPAAFIHNDYKYDNVVFHPQHHEKIIGVLDWEMATVGDPLMDLGATLAYWSDHADTNEVKYFNLTWLTGNLSRKEVVERYAANSGRDVSNIIFYYVFGLFKNAVIAQQIYARWKKGFTKDARFGALLPVIKGLAAKATVSLQTNSV